MKKLISITAVFLMIFAGCSKDVNLNSPIEKQTTEEYLTHEAPEGLSINGSFSVTKEIDGAQGGFLSYGNLSEAQSGNSGQVYAACFFPKGAFSGKKTITMTLDTKKCIGTFSPAMEFDKPVSFSAMYSGVNLSKYDVSQLAFVYFGANNVMTIIPSSYLYINKDKGVLGILNAQLPHFSRYGFVRLSE